VSTTPPAARSPGDREIVERIADVRARIAAAAARAGRAADDVTLVAVTKTVPTAAMRAALTAGVVDLGENRAQELLAKAPVLAGASPPPRWHFVGRLQRNKVKALAPWVRCWQSVDRVELGTTIARHAPGAHVLVEVNIGAEAQKGGCAPDDAAALVEALAGAGLCVEGLMAVPPAADDPRRHFAAVRALAARLGLATLSMGMSGDYEIAVEEGATIVRVGSAIFGPRPAPPRLRR
jgi:pyridoxal phosphate enzyme (YggS family)